MKAKDIIHRNTLHRLVHPLRRTHTQVFHGDWLELWKLNKANRITILEMRSRRVLSPPSLSVPFFLTLSLPPPSPYSPPLSFPPSFRFLFSPDSLFLSSYPPFVLFHHVYVSVISLIAVRPSCVLNYLVKQGEHHLIHYEQNGLVPSG